MNKIFLLLMLCVPWAANATSTTSAATNNMIQLCNGAVNIPESNPQGYFMLTAGPAAANANFYPFYKNGVAGASGGSGYQVTNGNSFHMVCVCSWGFGGSGFYQFVSSQTAWNYNVASLTGPNYQSGRTGGETMELQGFTGNSNTVSCMPWLYTFPSQSYPGFQTANTTNTVSMIIFGKETTP